MKVGLVCPYNLFRPGGVQEVVRALEQGLKARGHEVRIITPKPRGYGGTVPPSILFVGRSTKWNTPVKTTMDVGVNFMPTDLEAVLRAEQFDLLHLHEPEVPILGAQIIAKASCPTVATFHAVHPPTALAKTIEAFRVPYARSILKNITLMTAVSEAAADFVRQWSGREVTIIPNGIDLNRYHHLKNLQAAGPKTILYIGRLEKRKGVMALLKAYALLQNHLSKTRLIIVGDGPERIRLENYVTTRNLKGVEFLGFVSEKDKLALLYQANLFCSPALYGESFGIVLLEAMAAGTVIVAGNNPGYAAVLQDRGRISLVEPKDTPHFAERLELLLVDMDLRAVWQSWAAGYIRQFDYPLIIDRYEQAYYEAVKAAS